MVDDSEETQKTKDSDRAEIGDTSVWETPDRGPDNTAGETEQLQLDTATESGCECDSAYDELPAVDWSHRELSSEYPADTNYHCNECNDFHSNSIQELKAHIQSDEEIEWGEYLQSTGLHRCAGCGEPLASVADLYCLDCTQNGNDRVSCRNCGEVRVNLSDPFCSAACAGERIQATNGAPAPLNEPNNPSDEWLDHPHRLPTGIPSSIPFIENHTIACRECYEYGADSLHSFAVHVSERHDIGWGGYINKYALRQCRVCGEALYSLLPLYCSDVCQRADPNPVRQCKRDGCEAAVERRQKYCSWDCYTKADTE